MASEWSLLNVDESLIRRAPSLAEQTYEALKSWIVNGDLEAGVLLSENDLARRFSISRSPLREAIRALQDEGLLEASGPRGFSVPLLTTDLVRQIYGVRLALEAAAAATAVIPPDQLEFAQGQLARVQSALDEGDTTPFGEADIPFHDLFITNSGNPLLIKHIHRLRGNVQRVINYAGRIPGHTQASFNEHLVIFDAMKSADQEILHKAVSGHISGVTERIVSHLERHASTASGEEA
jgi:DNA-binding GntR family transcriptional regulator